MTFFHFSALSGFHLYRISLVSTKRSLPNLIDFGEAPTSEEVIHRPHQMVVRRYNVWAVW